MCLSASSFSWAEEVRQKTLKAATNKDFARFKNIYYPKFAAKIRG
jgi:hypothetical protein